MAERTVAQRYADYKKTFPKRINARRCDLIGKMYAGFTDKENARKFSEHPGWKEEVERRERANLTDAEWAEYAECTRAVDRWQAKAPWAIDQAKFMEEQRAKLDAILDRLKRENSE